MAVRNFDGIDDNIDFTPGAFDTADGTERVVWACIWKPDSIHSGGLFWNNGVFNVNNFNTGFVWWQAGGHAMQGPAYLANVWYLTIFGKPVGTGEFRSHMLNMGTGVWTHTNHGTLIPVAGADSGVLQVGHFGIASEWLDGKMAVQGLWLDTTPFGVNGAADADVEAFGLQTNLQNWINGSPDILWSFNQDPVSAIEDIGSVGTADQSGIVGTNVITGDDPPGFSFGGNVDPIQLGSGSVYDRIMAGLVSQGFTTGSIADRERARLLAKLILTPTQGIGKTLTDLYKLANEPYRLATPKVA